MAKLTSERDNGLHYLRDEAVVGIMADRVMPLNPYRSGYGPAVPTRWRLKLADNRTRRVYVMLYGNSGSAYVNVGGETAFLDVATEYRLSD